MKIILSMYLRSYEEPLFSNLSESVVENIDHERFLETFESAELVFVRRTFFVIKFVFLLGRPDVFPKNSFIVQKAE